MKTNAQTSSVLVRPRKEAFPEARMTAKSTTVEEVEPESQREIRPQPGPVWGFSKLFLDYV